MLLRRLHVAGAIAAAAIAGFLAIDSNISLYLYDAIFHQPTRLESAFGNTTVWIVGASSGIGEELAVQLSHAGAHVLISARRQEKLEKVAARCSSDNSITIIPLDVEDDGSITPAIDRVVGEKGGVDIIILNAGMLVEMPTLEVDMPLLRKVMKVNFESGVRIATEVMKRDGWEAKKSGHIVVTSSLGGKLGMPVSSAYSASKHALHGYFSSLRTEHPWLRVDIACPGPVDTSIFETATRPSDMRSIPGTVPGGSIMSAPRCARLMISAMMGPNLLFSETWIATRLPLLGVHIASYAPILYNAMSRIMDPLIMQNWNDGEGFGFNLF